MGNEAEVVTEVVTTGDVEQSGSDDPIVEGGSNEFSDMVDDFSADDAGEVFEEPAPEPEARTPEPEVQTPVTEAPAPAPEVVETGVAQVVETPAPEPEAKPEAAAPAPEPAPTEVQATPEELAARQAQSQRELETHFQIPPDMIDELQVSPEIAIPKLQAKMYQDVMASVERQIQQQVPNIVRVESRRSELVRKNEEDFFGEWPALKEHASEVSRIGRLYRQINPKTTKEDFIRDVGMQTMMYLKIPHSAPAADTQGEAVVKPPAGLGTRGTVPASSVAPSTNEFEILSQEIMEFDES